MANLKESDLFPFYINNRKLKIIDGKKYCSICREYVNIELFKENKSKYLGREYWCSDCLNLEKENKLINYIKLSRDNLRHITDLQTINHLNKFDSNLTVDHIIPISAFKANKITKENIHIINDYRNLIKISLKNNLHKSDKITFEFIPSWHIKDFIQYAKEVIDLNIISTEYKEELSSLLILVDC